MASDSAVATSSVVGVIILVAVAVFGAVFVWLIAGSFATDAIDEPPRILFRSDFAGPGGTLTVMEATNGMLWSQLSVPDHAVAQCTLPTGAVGPGDQIFCSTEGDWLLLHTIGSQATLVFDGRIE